MFATKPGQQVILFDPFQQKKMKPTAVINIQRSIVVTTKHAGAGKRTFLDLPGVFRLCTRRKVSRMSSRNKGIVISALLQRRNRKKHAHAPQTSLPTPQKLATSSFPHPPQIYSISALSYLCSRSSQAADAGNRCRKVGCREIVQGRRSGHKMPVGYRAIVHYVARDSPVFVTVQSRRKSLDREGRSLS